MMVVWISINQLLWRSNKWLFETNGIIYLLWIEIYDFDYEARAPFGGTIAGAKRRHGSQICYKNIYEWLFWIIGSLRILEKGFDLETPKKYTFALDGFHWVLFSMDFWKIAVLFLCILIFVFFATKNDRFWDIFVCFLIQRKMEWWFMMIYDDYLWSCPLRGHYRRRFAPPRHADLLQKYICNKIWESENFGKREFIWRPPKNTLLLWSK